MLQYDATVGEYIDRVIDTVWSNKTRILLYGQTMWRLLSNVRVYVTFINQQMLRYRHNWNAIQFYRGK